MLIDKTIPYKNILMKCDVYNPEEIKLPKGYHFRSFKEGDECIWAALEVKIKDFDTYENGVKYFKNKYMNNMDELKRRFICVEGDDGQVAGMVIAWFEMSDNEKISTLEWFVTDPEHQGKGIGTCMIKKLFQCYYDIGEKTVYLHTQPWSYAAISIYSKAGFRIMKTETIMGYENQYDEAVEILKEYLSQEKYEKLINGAI